MCEEKQLCGGKLVMSEKTDKQKKVIELVINGTPVSFYDANNGNVISALSFLHSVIETLAGDNVELLSSGFISQITIDKKDAKNLDASHFSNEELSLSSDCENEGQQALPYGDEPFVYTACLNLDDVIFWLEQQLESFRFQRSSIDRIERITKDLKETIAHINQHRDLIKNQHHHQESNLLKDSNRYAHNLKKLLLFLNNPEFQQENFPGINLLRE